MVLEVSLPSQTFTIACFVTIELQDKFVSCIAKIQVRENTGLDNNVGISSAKSLKAWIFTRSSSELGTFGIF